MHPKAPSCVSPNWANWGDCRIEQNELVRSRFEAELRNPRYIHAMPKTEFLELVSR